MANLIADIGLGTIVLVLIIAIPCIIGFISWCKAIWQKRQDFQNANIQKGKEMEARAEAKEARLVNGEKRMDDLEATTKELKDMAARQQELIELLIESDELSIKTWIKEQHAKWVPLGCIDNQTLELLEQRYAIYSREGGNSWAEHLMNDLRKLPIATIIPLDEIHDESKK